MIDWIFQGVVTVAIVLLCHLICRAGDLRRRAVAGLWEAINKLRKEDASLNIGLQYEGDMRDAQIDKLHERVDRISEQLKKKDAP